jgi:hypothetical protein
VDDRPLESVPAPQPIRGVVVGLGPALVAIGLLALGVAGIGVAGDQREFTRLQAAAEAAGSPGGVAPRPTAAMLFWHVGSPDNPPREERPRRRSDEDDTPFQAQVRAAARTLRAAGETSGHDVSAWTPSRAEMKAISSCTSTAEPLCAYVVEQLRRGCANEKVACSLPP